MSDSEPENFRWFEMTGECPACGCFETYYVGRRFIDEKCCWCGIIVGGGYFRFPYP